MSITDDLPAERGHFICRWLFMCMTDALPAERGHFICRWLFMCMTVTLPAERVHFTCKGLFMCMTDAFPASCINLQNCSIQWCVSMVEMQAARRNCYSRLMLITAILSQRDNYHLIVEVLLSSWTIKTADYFQ